MINTNNEEQFKFGERENTEKFSRDQLEQDLENRKAVSDERVKVALEELEIAERGLKEATKEQEKFNEVVQLLSSNSNEKACVNKEVIDAKERLEEKRKKYQEELRKSSSEVAKNIEEGEKDQTSILSDYNKRLIDKEGKNFETAFLSADDWLKTYDDKKEGIPKDQTQNIEDNYKLLEITKEESILSILENYFEGDRQKVGKVLKEFNEKIMTELIDGHKMTPEQAKKFMDWRYQNIKIGTTLDLRDGQLEIPSFVDDSQVDDFRISA